METASTFFKKFLPLTVVVLAVLPGCGKIGTLESPDGDNDTAFPASYPKPSDEELEENNRAVEVLKKNRQNIETSIANS